MKRFFVIFLIITACVAVVERGAIRNAYVEWSKPAVPSEIPASEATRTPTPTGVGGAIGAINLAVPFFSQAPRGDWSEPWQNACEESSAVLVNAFWSGEKLTADSMEQRILELVAWEDSHFGYYQETTAAQTARMIREVYGYRRVDVLYEARISDILSNVRAGRPVIVPLAGRLLGNPYYTAPGPVYHMLVVKGVAENGDLITNDVGTRHGRNLTYSPDVFLNAMHDLPQGGASFPANIDPEAYIQTGRPAIIVVYPN